MDQLILKYAGILRTAPDSIYEGILAEFARETLALDAEDRREKKATPDATVAGTITHPARVGSMSL